MLDYITRCIIKICQQIFIIRQKGRMAIHVGQVKHLGHLEHMPVHSQAIACISLKHHDIFCHYISYPCFCSHNIIIDLPSKMPFTDGKIFSWGDNENGQLGLGNKSEHSATPSEVKALSNLPIYMLAAGGGHSLALTVSGTLFAWGKNRFVQKCTQLN